MKRNPKRQKTHSKHVPAESSFEVIEVERNLIQNWLLSLQVWARENIKFLRGLLLASVFALLISLIFIGFYTALVRKQNYQFFSYLNRYNEYKELKSTEEKNKKLRALIKDCRELCYTFLKTSHSYNACLLEAASYIELKEYKKVSKPLDMFGQYNSKNGAGVFALFFAAQAYENLLDFEKAYQLYNQLEDTLKLIGKDDIIIYNKAKILYLQGKLDLAETMFQKIAYEQSSSDLHGAALDFLRLIAFKKHEKLNQKSKTGNKTN